jgi:molybdopterin-binding protein
MKLSARNQIMGKVISLQRGQTTGHVRIDIGNGIFLGSKKTHGSAAQVLLPPPSLRMKGGKFLRPCRP